MARSIGFYGDRRAAARAVSDRPSYRITRSAVTWRMSSGVTFKHVIAITEGQGFELVRQTGSRRHYDGCHSGRRWPVTVAPRSLSDDVLRSPDYPAEAAVCRVRRTGTIKWHKWQGAERFISAVLVP